MKLQPRILLCIAWLLLVWLVVQQANLAGVQWRILYHTTHQLIDDAEKVHERVERDEQLFVEERDRLEQEVERLRDETDRLDRQGRKVDQRFAAWTVWGDAIAREMNRLAKGCCGGN